MVGVAEFCLETPLAAFQAAVPVAHLPNRQMHVIMGFNSAWHMAMGIPAAHISGPLLEPY